MISTLFNRYDFPMALGVINFISLLIRSLTFSIMSLGLTRFGGYSGAYAIFAVITVVGIVFTALINDEMQKPAQ